MIAVSNTPMMHLASVSGCGIQLIWEHIAIKAPPLAYVIIGVSSFTSQRMANVAIIIVQLWSCAFGAKVVFYKCQKVI